MALGKVNVNALASQVRGDSPPAADAFVKLQTQINDMVVTINSLVEIAPTPSPSTDDMATINGVPVTY